MTCTKQIISVTCSFSLSLGFALSISHSLSFLLFLHCLIICLFLAENWFLGKLKIPFACKHLIQFKTKTKIKSRKFSMCNVSLWLSVLEFCNWISSQCDNFKLNIQILALFDGINFVHLIWQCHVNFIQFSFCCLFLFTCVTIAKMEKLPNRNAMK